MKPKRRRTKRARSVWDAFKADENESTGRDHDAARREATPAVYLGAAGGCSRIRPLYELEDL